MGCSAANFLATVAYFGAGGVLIASQVLLILNGWPWWIGLIWSVVVLFQGLAISFTMAGALNSKANRPCEGSSFCVIPWLFIVGTASGVLAVLLWIIYISCNCSSTVCTVEFSVSWLACGKQDLGAVLGASGFTAFFVLDTILFVYYLARRCCCPVLPMVAPAAPYQAPPASYPAAYPVYGKQAVPPQQMHAQSAYMSNQQFVVQ